MLRAARADLTESLHNSGTEKETSQKRTVKNR